MKQSIAASEMIFPAFTHEGRALTAYLPIQNVPLALPQAYLAVVANPEFKPDALIQVVNVGGPLPQSGVTVAFPVNHRPLYVDSEGVIFKSTIAARGGTSKVGLNWLGEHGDLTAKIGASHEFRVLRPTAMTLPDFAKLTWQVNDVGGSIEPRYNGFAIYFPEHGGKAPQGHDFRFATWRAAEAVLLRFSSAVA